MPTSVMWFRTDLRLHDQPALRTAIEHGPDGVVPLLVLDDRYWGPGASTRQAYLVRLLHEFDDRIGGLHIVHGDPVSEVLRVARQVEADTVHVSADYTPMGAERDTDVEAALAEHDIRLVRTGSPYAVAPGRVTKDDGTGYRVFTPFFRAWQQHGWRQPAPPADDVPWLRPGGRTHRIPEAAVPDGMTLPPHGERAALERWQEFLADDVADYDSARDLPGPDRTSRMSVHLKWGTIHPRTMLADLAPLRSDGAAAYARELAFREFYADVLHQRPDSAFGYYNRTFEHMEYDQPGDDLEAWKTGRTGIPIVDAGMRQLLGEGWMHNRVRMIVASFLVKDLHLEWQHGAKHFLDLLVDADIASNQHGWQWVAGSGTDASPYFRIFNPMTQGKKFDPEGEYVRRWVPELADVPSKHVHTPWELAEPPADYPAPLVDHAEERAESLRRYEAIRPAR
ncbi:cryptochrome/photolyase family protein [Aeromicrobium stalagmiti]|uniref:cryptochrome/photolyase family protein n=1 Tax=Aeromicrobium stalagmiti TaxID=2738988 RepID=UPI00156863F4|nr:deoxyribodipyrimidine photo-lyase [Aeromicrobium stalagmiti]NRQ48328.1 deoxyribodipyrimidine photo-lyase [Aeromicrobium stalagmiti]